MNEFLAKCNLTKIIEEKCKDLYSKLNVTEIQKAITSLKSRKTPDLYAFKLFGTLINFQGSLSSLNVLLFFWIIHFILFGTSSYSVPIQTMQQSEPVVIRCILFNLPHTTFFCFHFWVSVCPQACMWCPFVCLCLSVRLAVPQPIQLHSNNFF